MRMLLLVEDEHPLHRAAVLGIEVSNPVAVLSNANNTRELHGNVGVAIEEKADLRTREPISTGVALVVHHHNALRAKGVVV